MSKRSDRQRAQLRKFRRENKRLQRINWFLHCQDIHKEQKRLYRAGVSRIEKIQEIKMLSIDELFYRYDGDVTKAINDSKRIMTENLFRFMEKENLISFVVTDDECGDRTLKAFVYIGIPAGEAVL
ncbi:hypothetical protein [Anaerotignum sp.]